MNLIDMLRPRSTYHGMPATYGMHMVPHDLQVHAGEPDCTNQEPNASFCEESEGAKLRQLLLL